MTKRELEIKVAKLKAELNSANIEVDFLEYEKEELNKELKKALSDSSLIGMAEHKISKIDAIEYVEHILENVSITNKEFCELHSMFKLFMEFCYSHQKDGNVY